MSDPLEMVASILSMANKRAEIIGNNLANSTTPGFKRGVAFVELLTDANSTVEARPVIRMRSDVTPGKLIETGNAYDVSVASPAVFALGSDDSVVFASSAQFTPDAEGRLVTHNGLSLQLSTGSDLVTRGGAIKIDTQGRITEDGVQIGQLQLYDREDVSRPIEGAMVRQGFVESSNVSSGTEMVALMELSRSAQAGQRLAQTYDDMMGRALNSFAEAAR